MTSANRWQTFAHALAFVAGFSLVFVVMGATLASVFGFALRAFLPTFVKIGGIILILFGLQVFGVFGWLAARVRAVGGDKNPVGHAFVEGVDAFSRLMYTEGRIQKKVDPRWGYLSSALMGVFFSAGWIPCIGPVLSAIYAMAAITETAGQGALLLLVYSLGLGIPFLVTGAAMSRIAPWLRKMNRHLGVVSKITGLFLIIVGVMLFMDRLGFLAIFFSQQLGNGLASTEFTSNFSAVTIPLAFAAGLLSFLSPCVLPLIPAYIGYLSGTTVADRSPSGGAAHEPGKAAAAQPAKSAVAPAPKPRA